MARLRGRGNQGQEDLLFLKKKKQKDFIHCARLSDFGTLQEDKSFLVLFFKKEHASFFYSAPPSPSSVGAASDIAAVVAALRQVATRADLVSEGRA